MAVGSVSERVQILGDLTHITGLPSADIFIPNTLCVIIDGCHLAHGEMDDEDLVIRNRM